MMYEYKCDLNIETEIFKSNFKKWLGEPEKFNSVVIITAGDCEESENDSLEFIHEMRTWISKIMTAECILQNESNAKLKELREV